MVTPTESDELRMVPDLGDELLHALGQVEELLLTLAFWEQEEADVDLPAPFARGAALAALTEIQDTVRPTQSRDEDRPVPGRLLGPDGRYEHLPVRFVTIAAGDIAILEHAAQVLNLSATNDDLADALEQHAQANEVSGAELAGRFSRAVSVLTLAWDDDVRSLWRAVTAQPSGADVVLDVAGESAYRRVAARINNLWSYGSAIEGFRF